MKHWKKIKPNLQLLDFDSKYAQRTKNEWLTCFRKTFSKNLGRGAQDVFKISWKICHQKVWETNKMFTWKGFMSVSNKSVWQI